MRKRSLVGNTPRKPLKQKPLRQGSYLLNFLAAFKKAITGAHSAGISTEYTKELCNYYESIIACMPNNVYWLDRNCVLLGGNDNLARMFGLQSRAELVGLTYEQMVQLAGWTAGQGDVFKQAELEVMSSGIPRFNVDEPPVVIDGKTRYYMSSKVPLYNTKGRIIGVVGISTDITERKQAEVTLREALERVEAANRAKTEFLENMRHDIRTPLTGIIGFATIIRDEVHDPKIKEYADNLTASSQALLELLNEILEVVKLNSGEVPLLKKKFDLKKRLSDVIKLNQAKAQQKRVELMFEYDEKIPPYVIGDPTRIHRLVLELLVNALNFTQTGTVKLITQLASISGRDLVIKIIVEDTGVGIATEKQQDIFLQFKRLTPSYEGVYKGAGLGLAIVKQLLDELEGEIYVESQVGAGTTFTCLIPLKQSLLNEEFGSDAALPSAPILKTYAAAPKVLTNKAEKQQETGFASSRILLVEDQAIASAVVKTMLSGLDCDVDIAPSGADTLQKFHETDYNLILMDIGLPDMDGYEVARRIRLHELGKGTHVPIIALTAHVDDENKQRCIEVGMNAVLSKPLAKEKALDILHAFIPYRQSRRDAGKKMARDKDAAPFHIEGKIIDFNLAKKQIGGDEQAIMELLHLLTARFPNEIDQLNMARQKEDWTSIQTIAHKLNGDSSYCGTVRLREVCIRLETAIKNKQIDHMDTLYKQLLMEIHAIEEVVSNKSYLK